MAVAIHWSSQNERIRRYVNVACSGLHPLSHACAMTWHREEERMVRALGIEPRTPAWKAGVLPLNYARVERLITITGLTHWVKL